MPIINPAYLALRAAAASAPPHSTWKALGPSRHMTGLYHHVPFKAAPHTILSRFRTTGLRVSQRIDRGSVSNVEVKMLGNGFHSRAEVRLIRFDSVFLRPPL